MSTCQINIIVLPMRFKRSEMEKKRIIKFEAYFSIHSNNVSKTNQQKVPLAYFVCMGGVEFRTSEDIKELRS